MQSKHTGCSPDTYLGGLDPHHQKTPGFPKSCKNRLLIFITVYIQLLSLSLSLCCLSTLLPHCVLQSTTPPEFTVSNLA